MKIIIALALAASVAAPAMADEYVHGYARSDGTYVQPHYRSSPDGQQWNNYSTKGNVNPYTGQAGTQRDTTYDPPKPFNPYSNSLYR